jgi:hypothetical protein
VHSVLDGATAIIEVCGDARITPLHQAGDVLTLTVAAASQMTRKSSREGSGRDSDAWKNMRYTLQVLGGVRDPDPRSPKQWVKEVLGYIPSWVRSHRLASDHALEI